MGGRTVAACVVVLACTVFAQTSGTITGTVSDVIGEGVGRAPIQAKNVTTGAVYSASSTASGGYRLAGLPPGSYEVSINMLLYRRFVRQNVTVAAGQSVRLDIRLEDAAQLGTLGELYYRRNVKEPPSGRMPRTADGKPDLSGVWSPSADIDPETPAMLPWAAALVKQRTEHNGNEDPRAHCLPSGVARESIVDMSKLIQTPTLLLMLFEGGDPNFRQIFLDGRPHPKDLNPTWMGHSTGKWEGDTLVVDTIGFNDRVWVDFAGHPQTEQMHLTERYRRPDLGHLDVEFTLEDPGSYARPWKIHRVLNLAPNDEVEEYICSENNKPQHYLGK